MISIICPVYNESKHITKILRFFVNSNPAEKELIIADGGSTDNTKEIIKEWAERYSNIILIDNPDKYVPFALNLAIKKCSGDIVIRIDAHSDYAHDYFEKILDTFNATGAAIVGGPYLTKGKTTLQLAIANAISNPFGVGNSKAHNRYFTGYVDSVPLGAWKRELFDEIGYFDERLKRNQDDEFNYRAKSLGKKIYLNPDIKFWYYPRSSLKSLFRQYFEYGIYKPLVLNKIKSEIKLRHLIPAVFVIYLLGTPLSLISPMYIIPLIIYLLIDLLISFSLKGGIKTKLWSIVVYPILHFSYGAGFILGLSKLFP